MPSAAAKADQKAERPKTYGSVSARAKRHLDLRYKLHAPRVTWCHAQIDEPLAKLDPVTRAHVE